MTRRRHTPLHDFWHRRVEGQIRDAMHSHPEWFRITSERQKQTIVNSLAKRIVGEIVAALYVAAKRAEVAHSCSSTSGSGGGFSLPPDGGEVAANCLPSDAPEPYRNELLIKARLDIRGGRIHYRLYQQDGSMQAMDCPDTLDNRVLVSWMQAHDRYTPGGNEANDQQEGGSPEREVE